MPSVARKRSGSIGLLGGMFSVAGSRDRAAGGWNPYAFLAALAAAFLVIKANQLLHAQLGPGTPMVLEPAGIGIAAAYLGGYRFLIPLALGSAFAVLTHEPVSLLAALIATAAFTAQAFAGAYLLRRLDFEGGLQQARSVRSLVGIAFLMPFVPVALGFGLQWLAGLAPAPSFGEIRRVWMGGAMSITILTPLITTWLTPQEGRLRRAEIVEQASGLAALAGVTYLIAWTPLLQTYTFFGLYLFFASMLWIALRMRPRTTTVAALIIAGIGISGTVAAHPGGAVLAQQQLFGEELFMTLIMPIFFFVTSLVTERRMLAERGMRHERELEVANTRLAQANESKNEFIAILAHELRNPLAVAVNSLEIMRLQAADRPDLRQLIAVAEAQNRTLARIIDDLLDMTRLERKRFALEVRHVDLRDVVKRSTEAIAEAMRTRRHTLAVSLPEGDLGIRADPVRIEQVLVNLLANAVKYTDPGGKISLEVEREPEGLRICVRDNGKGIDPRMIDDIFKPFVQAGRDEAARDGLGIGLPLARELVAMHRGKIWAESEGAGKGSAFYVFLPAPAAAA